MHRKLYESKAQSDKSRTTDDEAEIRAAADQGIAHCELPAETCNFLGIESHDLIYKVSEPTDDGSIPVGSTLIFRRLGKHSPKLDELTLAIFQKDGQPKAKILWWYRGARRCMTPLATVKTIISPTPARGRAKLMSAARALLTNCEAIDDLDGTLHPDCVALRQALEA